MRWPKASELLAVACLGAVPAATAQPLLYEVVTETGMPHLEENLRHAVATERRCATREALADTFWMLRDVSLQDCRLALQRADADGADYRLVCTGGHGTEGRAAWRFDGAQARGQLDVRLGGKNMTFWQRIVARPVGACP